MANFEDLKNAWQAEVGISQARFDQIGSKVHSSSELLQKTIFRRDMLETVASIVVVAAFSPGLFSAKNWVAWTGFAIVVFAGCTIPIVLWRARKRSPATVSAANFCDFVDIEIDYLCRQVRLLRMVTWWYLLPIYVSIVLIVVGLTGHRHTQFNLIFCIIYLSCVTGFFIWVWWLNQSASKTHMQPLLQYYVEMRTALESGDEFDRQLPGPPSAFLQPRLRKPMTNRRRWFWIAMTAVVTALVAGAGIVAMQSFDARTGKFVVSCAPVMAFLMIYISGLWRR